MKKDAVRAVINSASTVTRSVLALHEHGRHAPRNPATSRASLTKIHDVRKNLTVLCFSTTVRMWR